MLSNPNDYFNKKQVVSIDIIHHKCRGYPLKQSYKEHKTVKESDFIEY